MGLSTSALVSNTTRALLTLCEPFIDPTAFGATRIDIRYISNTLPNGNGGGRCVSFIAMSHMLHK
jgi:hypothetical protein